MSDIPKNIWLMWYNGVADMPDVVSVCIASWRHFHPDWNIVILDRHSISQYIDIRAATGKNQDEFSIIVLSDIVRINLLARYGGVWADATCYCTQSLSSWLPPYTVSGFFAFRNPGPDREISTWFIAACADGLLIRRYQEEVNEYWRSHHFSGHQFKFINRWLTKVLGRNQKLAQRWFSPLFTRVLKIHPYFWSHYLFARLVNRDELCRRDWEHTPIFAASIPHVLLTGGGLTMPMSARIREMIQAPSSPVFKLSWKYDRLAVQPDSPLDYIFKHIPVSETSPVYAVSGT